MLIFTLIGVMMMLIVCLIFTVVKIYNAVKSYLINKRGMDKWDADTPAIMITIFVMGFILTILGLVFR